MGICSSYQSASVATAKLILQDGKLVEFPYSPKVSFLLQKYPSSFICNSDSMEFGHCASAMYGDDELLPGYLYFSLPLSKLKCPLQPEEMAALAVKASIALVNRTDAYGQTSQMFGRDREEQDRRISSCGENGVGGGMVKKSRRSSSKSSGRSFTTSLTVIHEQSYR